MEEKSTEDNIIGRNPDVEFESEIEGEVKHESLLSSVFELHKSKQHGSQQRGEVSSDVSEYSFGIGKVYFHNLLGGVGDLTPLNDRLDSVCQRNVSLESPLPNVFADKIHRSVNYKKTLAVVEKWDPIVKCNRETLHMKFPIQEGVTSLPSLQSKVETFVPLSNFEEQVAAIIAEGTTEEKFDKLSSEGEAKSIVQVSVKEARQRRKELMKMRALMCYREIKHRRMKRIKSKKFHRIQRRRQLPPAARSSDLLPDIIEKAKKLRAMERMTLKHTNVAKWAKQQLSRDDRDPAMEKHSHQRSEGLGKCTESDIEDADITQSDANNLWIFKKESSMNSDGLQISPNDYMQVNCQKNEIYEAFAGDNVSREFEEEKEDRVNTEKSLVALPGWGSWSDEGLKQKKLQTKASRKDGPTKHMINEQQDKKFAKHMIGTVPWPYETLQHLEETHSTPLGRHWNSETTFHNLIKPPVLKAIGAAIRPLKVTDIEDTTQSKVQE